MKICFIGEGISNAIEGDIKGGAEKQIALIIKGLKSKGTDIIVFEYYLEKPRVIDGINFHPAWSRNKKSFLGKFRCLFNQIRRNNVNSIYVRGTQLYAAFLFFLFKVLKIEIKLYWGLAHDHNLTAKYNYIRMRLASSIYEKINLSVLHNIYSILLFYFSDIIICQTHEQIEMCRLRSEKKPTILISNIYTDNIKDKKSISKKIMADAIWVGKFSGSKGEDILLKIAKDIPNIKIICLGHVSEMFEKTKTFQDIKKQNNLILVGRIPNHEVGYYISETDFVLNTSPAEGLSNVFLEGWRQEKPVVSFVVNPNKYLTKGEAGYCAQGSYAKLIKNLCKILKDDNFMHYHGKKGVEILKRNHSSEVIIVKYHNLFLIT